MTEKIWDVVIIGGGPAGYSAALYSVRAGLNVLVLEMLTPGGQLATTSKIDNYPGFEDGIGGFELAQQMQLQAEHFGVQTMYAGAEKLELTVSPKLIHTSEGTIKAHTVMLATGASPRHMGLEAEERLQGLGVTYCATCDGMFYRGKTVAVAGGGNSAAEDALVLSKLCKKVYVVHRRDTLRASKSSWGPLNAAENIEFLWNNKIVDLEGSEKLSAMVLESTQDGSKQTIPIDGLFVAIGRKPSTELIQGQVDLDEYGYIIADETTRTNIPGVYAVGDVRQKPLRQVVTAVADGAVASKYAEEYLNELNQ